MPTFVRVADVYINLDQLGAMTVEAVKDGKPDKVTIVVQGKEITLTGRAAEDLVELVERSGLKKR
jgi:hypothetical protein